MLKKISICMLIAVSIVLQLNAQKKAITVEDLYSVTRISDYTISPDGKWVLYKATKPNMQENKSYGNIYAVSIDGKQTIQITNDNEPKSYPVWGPKSDRVAYIASKDGTNHIYVCDFPNGTPSKVATFNEDIGNLDYAPNGNYFSFTKKVKVRQTVAEKYPNYSKANVLIYDSLPARHWDHWIDENVSHLFIMPVSGPASVARDVMQGEPFDTPLVPFGGKEEIAWSPDSKEIAYTCKKYAGVDFVRNTNSDIYIYQIEGGGTKNITEGMMGYDKMPVYSPDGKTIAFTSQLRNGFESDKVRLMLYNRANANLSDLTKDFDQWVFNYLWAPDSRNIFLTATNQGTYQIFKAEISTRKITQFSKGNCDFTSPSISADGKTIVFGMTNMARPLEICSIPASGGDVVQITRLNTEFIDKFAPSTFEERWIKSTDGKMVHCWVVYPPNFDKNKKYPLITYCQGGPQQMISQAYGYRWNMSLLTSRGYVIVAPNRRGCPGFGQDWIDAITHDWGGMPMQDIMAATDSMKKEAFIDPDKCVAMGASAGGFTTFWLAGNHEGRYKAFMSHCGVFDFVSMYGSTEELFFPDWEYGGPYWEAQNKAFYEKNSPHMFADKWDTPMIISTGEKDFRVPYTQSLEAFTVAQLKGLASELIVYPEETHFIAKSQEYAVWFNEVFNFFDRHTGNKP